MWRAERKRIAVLLMCLCFGAPALAAGPDVTPLVSSVWLAEHLDDDELVVLDLRSARDFERGHVPGAVRTDFPDLWYSERDGIPARRPEINALETHLTELGISNETTVVVVSASLSINDLTGATWVYWNLKYLGHDRVAILDGGWDDWSFFNDLRVEEGPTTPTPADPFVADPREEILAETDYVVERYEGGATLIDARSIRNYSGAQTLANIELRPGHIPGAINVPNDVFYDGSTVRFAEQAVLEAQVPPELSDRTMPLIVYCSIGRASSMSWFVFHELLGYEDVRLYEASMAAWTRRDDLPLVTGEAP